MKNKYDLYFSQEQLDRRQEKAQLRKRYRLDPIFDSHVFGKLENGSIVEYTEAVKSGSPYHGNFADAILVGRGDYHHSEKFSKYPF